MTRLNDLLGWFIVAVVLLSPIPLGSNPPIFWAISGTLVGAAALIYFGRVLSWSAASFSDQTHLAGGDPVCLPVRLSDRSDSAVGILVRAIQVHVAAWRQLRDADAEPSARIDLDDVDPHAQLRIVLHAGRPG